MLVLFTAPSNVILSAKGIDSVVFKKFLEKAGLPDLPNVFSAECFDIQISYFLYIKYLWAF
jgi:hypothetical protein